jgi:rod shape determining protein RodA
MFDFSALRELDWLLILVMVLIVGIGIVAIYSASYDMNKDRSTDYWLRQLIWFGLGICLFLFSTCFEYRKLRTIGIPIYIVSLLLLLYVIPFGQEHGGAQRWIKIWKFELQPSEFAKLSVIIGLTLFLAEFRKFSESLRYTLIPLVIVCGPVFLIFKQPDLGTALTLMPVLFGMLFIARARMKYIILVIFLGIAAMPALWINMKVYQKQRVIEYLTPGQRHIAAMFMRQSEKDELKTRIDPKNKYTFDEALTRYSTSWNSEQAMIAVGSGGLYGSGWLSGLQTQREFLPSSHTDFIFAALGEEWGFMGCLLVLMLYYLLIHVSTRIACEAQDFFGRLLGMGIVFLFVAHIVINVSMTIGLIPITGLPLPLLSYGGSSVWTFMIAIGLLESIHSRRHYFKTGKYSLQA